MKKFVLGALAVIAAAGCSSPKKFVGTWEGKRGPAVIEWTLNEDGTQKVTLRSDEAFLRDFSYSMDGTYSVSKDVVTSKLKAMPTLPGPAQRIVDEFIQDPSKPAMIYTSWKNNDAFIANFGRRDITFKRKK